MYSRSVFSLLLTQGPFQFLCIMEK